MRPDEHKAKESRRYQARKKQQGDATSAEVAAQRRAAAAKARDTGTSIAAIKRRNGELPSLQQPRDEQEAELRARSRQFSRRKLVSNQYRYQEMTEQGNKKNTHDRIIHPAVNNWFSPFQKPWHIDEMEQDAEMGADRETTNLVAMLEKNGMDTSLLSKAKTPLNLWLRYIYIYNRWHVRIKLFQIQGRTGMGHGADWLWTTRYIQEYIPSGFWHYGIGAAQRRYNSTLGFKGGR